MKGKGSLVTREERGRKGKNKGKEEEKEKPQMKKLQNFLVFVPGPIHNYKITRGKRQLSTNARPSFWPSNTFPFLFFFFFLQCHCRALKKGIIFWLNKKHQKKPTNFLGL